MEETSTFNKIINDFYIQVEILKGEPNQISFILVQNMNQQCFELKFGIQSMPFQLSPLFKSIRDLYEYIFKMQDNRNYFDITREGKIKIVKQIIENNNLVENKTIILTTYPVKIKESSNEDGRFIQSNYKQNYSNAAQNRHPNQPYNYQPFAQHFSSYQYNQYRRYSQPMQTQNTRNINLICQSALRMIQNGDNYELIARTLKIKYETVRKMMMQVKMYGTIYPPQRQRIYYNNYNNFQNPQQSFRQNLDYQMYCQANDDQYYHINQKQEETRQQAPPKQLGPVTPNMKMHGDGVKEIKKLLFVLVKQGKMQSLDEMRNFLLEKNIDRSLSSIYRYISSIKAQHPEFQGRNYTMYRKDLENTISSPKSIPKDGAGSKNAEENMNE